MNKKARTQEQQKILNSVKSDVINALNFIRKTFLIVFIASIIICLFIFTTVIFQELYSNIFKKDLSHIWDQTKINIFSVVSSVVVLLLFIVILKCVTKFFKYIITNIVDYKIAGILTEDELSCFHNINKCPWRRTYSSLIKYYLITEKLSKHKKLLAILKKRVLIPDQSIFHIDILFEHYKKLNEKYPIDSTINLCNQDLRIVDFLRYHAHDNIILENKSIHYKISPDLIENGSSENLKTLEEFEVNLL